MSSSSCGAVVLSIYTPWNLLGSLLSYPWQNLGSIVWMLCFGGGLDIFGAVGVHLYLCRDKTMLESTF